MFKKSRYPKPVRPTIARHHQSFARAFGVPTAVLVLIVLVGLLFATFLVWSIYVSIAEHANALVIAGVHPDIATALTAMLVEYIGVPLMYLAVFLIVVGIGANWVQRELKGC